MTIRLLEHRSVLLPTLPGLLVFLTLVAGATLLFVYGVARFMAPNDPIGNGVLVVEGWMDGDEIGRAAEAFRRGRYSALVVTGGPILDAPRYCGPRTYAERAAEDMRELGIVEPVLAVVPSPATERNRTYRSALDVRRWLESRPGPPVAVDVASHGPHARRSRALYRMALGGAVDVGVLSVLPSEYDLPHWWRTSAGVNDMITEVVGYAWMLCCFRPDAVTPGPATPPANAKVP